MKFKPGQQVVCVKNGDWVSSKHGIPVSDGPRFNEVCTVSGYNTDIYLTLKEHGIYGYNEIHFEPLVSDEVLREELETVKEPYTI